jgi:hypothetical protein
MACPHQHDCELFPLFNLRASLRTWQIRYCEADYSVCQRYQLAIQGERPPKQLLPNGKELPIAALKR